MARWHLLAIDELVENDPSVYQSRASDGTTDATGQPELRELSRAEFSNNIEPFLSALSMRLGHDLRKMIVKSRTSQAKKRRA